MSGIPSSPRGHVDVAIQFDKHIHNFKGHQTRGQYIYESEDYTLFSHVRDIDKNFFGAQFIEVVLRDGEQVLLEDYAERWILSPDRDASMFDSKDFLEQVSITHSIWRIREEYESMEPWNDYRREKRAETSKILDAMLRILEPAIRKAALRFWSKRKDALDQGEVLAQALQFGKIMITGEDPKVIESVNKPKGGKQEARQHDREFRLHPLRTHQGRDNIDIQKIDQGAVEEILKMGTISPQMLETAVLMFEPNAFSSFVSSTINYNSDRIYKPWFEPNLRDFICGKKGVYYSMVERFLKDHFKSELKRRRTRRAGSYAPRRWKINRQTRSESEAREVMGKVSFLPPKQLRAYMSWYLGSYASQRAVDRQNLRLAKLKIRAKGVDVPLPKDQKPT